jgi:hypothetical protein
VPGAGANRICNAPPDVHARTPAQRARAHFPFASLVIPAFSPISFPRDLLFKLICSSFSAPLSYLCSRYITCNVHNNGWLSAAPKPCVPCVNSSHRPARSLFASSPSRYQLPTRVNFFSCVLLWRYSNACLFARGADEGTGHSTEMQRR